jgi:hypothetical protein
LRAVIWPDAHVSETSLHVLVSQLRATLGDDAQKPRFVRTVPGFGYSFSASANEDVLGRDEHLGARVDGLGVSRRHARVLVHGGRAVLEDLASKNGTFLDGERVVSPRALEDGATIRLGRRASVVFRSDAADPTETEGGDG